MYTRRLITILLCAVSALFAIAVASPGARAQQGTLGIAAVVNDDVISVLDLHNRVSMIISTSNIENTDDNRNRIAPQILRGLIDEKLMLQEAQRTGINVAQEDIDAGIERIARGNNATIAQLAQHMESLGVPMSALTGRIEAEIAWNIFANRVLANSIKIGEEEISDEIQRIQSSAGKPEYLLAEIFLPVDKPSQDGEVRQLAMRLMQQMQAGAPFSGLARNFSRAPSAAQAGDLGWVQASHLDPDLLRAVNQLQPGQVTPPVHTLGGYYLILLRDVRTSPGLGGGDATIKVTQLHMAATPQTGMDALAAHLARLTQGVNACPALEAIGAKSGSPLSGPLGEVSLSALPPNMRAVLENLPVGQPSRPISTGGGLAVLMICERQDFGVDMEAIRAEIATRLKSERLDIVARRHLRDMRRTAFVEIRI